MKMFQDVITDNLLDGERKKIINIEKGAKVIFSKSNPTFSNNFCGTKVELITSNYTNVDVNYKFKFENILYPPNMKIYIGVNNSGVFSLAAMSVEYYNCVMKRYSSYIFISYYDCISEDMLQ